MFSDFEIGYAGKIWNVYFIERRSRRERPSMDDDVTTRMKVPRDFESLRSIIIERIAPTPLLMIVGDVDVVCTTDLALDAFNRAHEPKRLELFHGGHFSAYTDQLERASRAATEWFSQHLKRR